MKVIEVTGTSYPTAVELPNHGGRPQSKHQKSPGGNSGSGNTKTKWVPELTGRLLAEQQKLDREITAANKKVLLLLNGKRKLILESDYRAGRF